MTSLSKREIIAAVSAEINDPTRKREIRREVAEAVDAYTSGHWDQYAEVMCGLFSLHETAVDHALTTPENGETADQVVTHFKERNRVRLLTFEHINSLIGA